MRKNRNARGNKPFKAGVTDKERSALLGESRKVREKTIRAVERKENRERPEFLGGRSRGEGFG